MTTPVTRSTTLVIPNMVDRFPGGSPPGNPPDGYVIAFHAADGYYIAKPPSKISIMNTVIQAQSPYTVTSEDVVLVTHSGVFTVNLPLTPPAGTNLIIKDFSGNASSFNITVSTAQLIDGAATYLINTNYGSVRVVFTGTTWAILSKF